jgi:pyruvate formate lyase activating enzyme
MNPDFQRRRFLKACAAAGAGAVSGVMAARPGLQGIEARHYRKLPGGKIQCELCPWACTVDSGDRGKCEVRENRKGVYRSLVYGQVAARHVDPIEKKPFFHFLPGSAAYSIATVGCNFNCKFCQNWDLSQRRPEAVDAALVTADTVTDEARRAGCTVLSYTYSEPTVFNEFVFDVASAGRRAGLRSTVVSNGYIQKQPLLELTRVIDAYKVDLKSFDDGYYRKVCDGRLRPVLDTLVTLKANRVWCEIVVLLVPTLNDSEGELRGLSRWVVRELGPDVPVHFSRFYPQYKLRNLPPTPLETLERAWTVAREAGLRFVYLGNIPGHVAENTACPSCGEILIERAGFQVSRNRLRNGRCFRCNGVVAGVWN